MEAQSRAYPPVPGVDQSDRLVPRKLRQSVPTPPFRPRRSPALVTERVRRGAAGRRKL
jgi:hypothetical protein